ncbi:hypothetical protein GCM10011374_36920 [Kocuria dechangensis]|uniref:Uncharacterized protein n=1 Tax=Kocuria dechangensis TaxID=1176249 RepID=A0A917M0P8_9MICC|nr:hypothetical protein GCM10011374_36920 [Kocuria dechangensis]
MDFPWTGQCRRRTRKPDTPRRSTPCRALLLEIHFHTLGDTLTGIRMRSVGQRAVAQVATAWVRPSPSLNDRAAQIAAGRAEGVQLGVSGHEVGCRRLIGGWPPSALWRRPVL